MDSPKLPDSEVISKPKFCYLTNIIGQLIVEDPSWISDIIEIHPDRHAP